eukprot:637570-Prorocentrum_minimum.AAC.1
MTEGDDDGPLLFRATSLDEGLVFAAPPGGGSSPGGAELARALGELRGSVRVLREPRDSGDDDRREERELRARRCETLNPK